MVSACRKMGLQECVLLSVMQEVVGEIVANVAEEATAEDGGSNVPIPRENSMCKLIEGSREEEEEGRGHDEAIPVHRKIVMNAVEEKVSSDADSVVWEVSAFVAC